MRLPRILAAALLAGLASAASADDASPLQAWVGKHPSDKPIAGQGTLLAQPRLRDGLAKLLPAPERALLKTLDVESQVRQSGDFLVIDKCLPHDCPARQAMIVVDLRSERLWVAFFTHTDGHVSTRWYGNVDDYNAVPQDVQTDFLKRHGSIAP